MPSPPTHHPEDLSSLSNPSDVAVTNLEWEATVDFEDTRLIGSVTYTLQRNGEAKRLCLDTSHLVIRGVTDDKDTALSYTLHPVSKPHLGQLLEISLESGTGTVKIDYSTTPQSSASQWLPPSQTAGKKYPYLFTQCQAIHARSLFPCQDRPGVKMTYTARITCPQWSTCVMSALLQKQEDVDDKRVFYFHQPVPISSYLVALAVGDLAKVDVSDRIAIYSEPSVVQSAAHEFAQTNDFLKIATDLAGTDYVWKRYDLLCLPPSFPYGGMENPCLTFVTPTLLAGDRSLADVVAHEIAHSWTGNLVTNATWQHFWLNEGWTTWFQRKIMAKIHNNEKFVDFDAIGGYKDLKKAVALMPAKFTKLIPILGDADPDEYFSTVPYEKGFNLLYALEQKVGTPDFERFFQAYLKEFAFKTLTSEDFKEFFLKFFEDRDEIQHIDWGAWFHQPGMPPEEPNFDESLAQASQELAERWLTFDTNGRMLPDIDTSSWTTSQVLCFLDALQGHTFKHSTLDAMNAKYSYVKSHNAEILFRYCQLALAAKDSSILPIVVRFVTTQGRMKFTRPLYRSLYQFQKNLAIETFLQHQDFYHPICAKMVAGDLQIDKKKQQKRQLWMAVGVAAVAAGIMLVLTRKRRSR